MTEAERLHLLAHELRSPVAALAALAEAYPTAPAGVRRRALELAVEAGRDIERILGDVELLSLRLEPTHVGTLVGAFASDAVEVRIEGDPRATVDPTRIRQAIANLVANGLRHGSHVVLDVRESDGAVLVDVSDDGPGVDSRIDPFARGTSTAGSTGLGLWLALGVAEAHGGTLERVPGGPGARFRLFLPSSSGAR